MPVKCCIINCKIQKDDVGAASISFHAVPSKEESKKAWLEKIKDHANVSLKYLYVCSKHFTKESYTGNGTRRKLKHEAFPTIFANNSSANQNTASPNVKSEHQNVISNKQNEQSGKGTVSPANQKEYDVLCLQPDELQQDDMDKTVRCANVRRSLANVDLNSLSFSSDNLPVIKNLLFQGQREIKILRRKVASSRMTVYRYKKKMTDVTSLLSHMKQHKLIDNDTSQALHAPVQPGSMDSEAGIFSMTFDQSGVRLITTEADKTIKIYKEDETATEETSNQLEA